jgi:small subunit ribosomal protein S20
MANHKSAKKAARKAVKRNLINKSRTQRIKTYIRRAHEALLGKTEMSVETLQKEVLNAEREIMKGVRKGIFHKNTAARKVSKLTLRFNCLKKASEETVQKA